MRKLKLLAAVLMGLLPLNFLRVFGYRLLGYKINGAKIGFAPGTSVGDDFIVAMGSVVTKKFRAARVMIGGVPAK